MLKRLSFMVPWVISLFYGTVMGEITGSLLIGGVMGLLTLLALLFVGGL